MSQKTNDEETSINTKPLNNWVLLVMFIYGTMLFGLIIILPAWNLGWVEGWVYVLAFMGITIVYYYNINKKDPTVLRNRMKIKKTGVTDEIKKEADSDKWLLPLLGIPGFLIWILPGLDKRYGWTNIPFIPLIIIEIIGFIAEIIGVILINMAQLQNAYASKMLDINKNQKLIDSGLYAHVRHPLYSGAALWFLGTPFALGSLYAIIPAVLTIIVLLIRIKFEEEMLIKGMDGYEDYRTRVKYKLIPKIY
ncbi:MAG: methyltransferase family protein [Promethearchaeota archaeon]